MTPAEVQRLFEVKEIEIDIDTCFLRLTNYPISTHGTRISFRLIDLILAFGTLHSSRLQNSNRIKIMDYYRYIDRVKQSRDFQIDITAVRRVMHADGVLDTSYFFGSALSLVLADKLFHTQTNALKKITGSKRRADYEGFSLHNHLVVLEAKGTSYLQNRPAQITKARKQIATKSAFIKIISSGLLNENTISHAHLIDPPGDDVPFDQNTHAINQADNFSKLFNLLGHQELAHYFKLMMKKIQNQRDWAIVDEKENIFEKIINEYDSIEFKGFEYKGKHFKDGSSYVFVGVRKDLVYFREFLQASSLKMEDNVFDEQDRMCYLYLNSILFIAMKESRPVSLGSKLIDNDLNITMNDIHFSPKGVSDDLIIKVFIRYFHLTNQEILSGKGSYLFTYNRQRILVLIKRFFGNKNKRLALQKYLKKLDASSYFYEKIIVISPHRLPEFEMKNIVVLDRKDIVMMINGDWSVSRIE